MTTKKTQLTSDSIKEINRLHERIGNAFRSSITDAIRIGELLTEKKKALKHGEFIPWVEKHCLFNRRAATNYMKVYANREDVQALPDVTSAYRLLGMRKQPSEKNARRNTPLDDVIDEEEEDAEPEIATASETTPEDVDLESPEEEIATASEPPLDEVTDEEEVIEPEVVKVVEAVPEDTTLGFDEEPEDVIEEEVVPEDTTLGFDEEPYEEPVDTGPPIDLSDPVFEEPEREPDPELLPGKTPKEIIALSGLPKPLNWKGEAKLPPEEPLKVLVIEMTGEDAGEVIEVAEGTIWDVMRRYEKRDGLRFACGMGVKKGQKVGRIWEDKPDASDPLREKRDALPVSWVEIMYELTQTRLTEERVAGILEQLLAKARG